MKPGDFVSVHMEYGCVIGKILEIKDDTMDIEFDNGILTDVPFEAVIPWVLVWPYGI